MSRVCFGRAKSRIVEIEPLTHLCRIGCQCPSCQGERAARVFWNAWTTRTEDRGGFSRTVGAIGTGRFETDIEIRLPSDLPDIAAGLIEARAEARIVVEAAGVKWAMFCAAAQPIARERYDKHGQTMFEAVAAHARDLEIEEDDPIPMGEDDMACIRDGLRLMLGMTNDQHPVTGERLNWEQLVNLHDDTTIRLCEEAIEEKRTRVYFA